MTATGAFAVVGMVTVGAVLFLLAVLVLPARRAMRMAPVPVRARGRVLVLPEAELELADFFDCPREGRRTAHAVSLDGSRRCWDCGHTTTPGGAR
ncbi:hypothetical protein [Streptomyces sp. NRRL S-350]|uniref:hypothetical protein n=1 Tax=Streptomyces sp. NRRL S-350 TaxID=1463902 RepID=UPI0004C06AAA|nr:hypothetical protein [Streptomyces sp. NRRL S-350]